MVRQIVILGGVNNNRVVAYILDDWVVIGQYIVLLFEMVLITEMYEYSMNPFIPFNGILYGTYSKKDH